MVGIYFGLAAKGLGNKHSPRVSSSFKEVKPISDTLDTVKEVGKEVVESRSARMFGRHTIVSTIAFALDLAILWGLVELVQIAHMPAAAVAFLIPMTLAYVLEREWVFPGTRRGVAKGYLYFTVNVGLARP